MKLGTKINLVLVVVIAVTLTVAFWVIINIESANLKRQVINDAATVTDVLRLNIEGMSDKARDTSGTSTSLAIFDSDVVILQKIADSISESNLINNLVVFNNQLEVVVSTGNKKDEFSRDQQEYKQLREDVLVGKIMIGETERLYDNKPIIVRVVPISSRDTVTGLAKNAGLIEVHIAKESYEAGIEQLKIRLIGLGVAFTALLVVVLAVILEREVVGPIRRYSIVARKIAEGDLNQSVEHRSNDEIGRFGEVFNSMVGSLRELDKMKSDFISVAAHQLRTPLAGIKWVLKLLLDGDLGEVTEDQKGMLTRGYETGQKMSQLVDDLLNVSRIENDKFGYKIEKNDFAQLLGTLMENVSLPSRERNIEVSLENNAGEIPAFLFDKDKLLIAIQNIVDNAIKYTLPGGKVSIVVERQNNDYLQIKVTDTGVGIPKAEIPKLFSKFFRAANVVHLQTDGSGLGLFIVKNIVLRHGGQLWVDSEEGRGTTIAMVIPTNPELLPKQEQPAAPQV